MGPNFSTPPVEPLSSAPRPPQHAAPPSARAAAVAGAMGYPTLLTLAYFVWLADSPPLVQQLAYGLGKPLQFALPILLVAWLWKEPLRWPPMSNRGLGWGIGFGLLVVAAMWALYACWFRAQGTFGDGAESMRQRLVAFGIDTPMRYTAMGIFYSLLHSLLEEYYWRWFVFRRLATLIPLWPAIALSSLAFMSHHVVVLGIYFGFDNPWTWLFSAATAIGGAYWAWLYQHSGSIYGPWVSHLLIDAGIFAVGYDLFGLTPH